MKRNLILLSLCLIYAMAAGQTDSLTAIEEIVAFQQQLNKDYGNAETSPLNPDDLQEFQGHNFFPIDLKYRVNAKLTVTEGTPFFGMKTSTSRLATERIYGYVTFTLDEKPFRLPVYQSKDLMGTAEYGDYLFFPFSDETNGETTYGGGRYIDLRVPKSGDSLIIDFNKAYNPYCAYSARYSCPIVPAENQINIKIPVGIRYVHKLNKDSVTGDSAVVAVNNNPEYPGGLEAMYKFVQKHMNYPKSARKGGISGKVYVQFLVQKDGSVTDVQTIRGIQEDCNREAERVVAMMPKWRPGKKDGVPVTVRYVIPLIFKL